MTALEQTAWDQAGPGGVCPVCGHDSWCRWSPDTNDEGEPNVVACRRVESPHERTYGDGTTYWLHKLGETDRSKAGGGERVERAPLDDAEADLRDRVYRRLLELLGLKDEHRDDLGRRGLSDEAIEAAGYGSLPYSTEDFRVSTILVRDFDRADLDRIPGLKRYRNDTLGLTHASGLLIPVRDVEGRIIALRVRRPVEEPKYVWLSSPEKSTGAPVHVPTFEGDPIPTFEDDQPLPGVPAVRITEGELKADVATVLSGILTVSVPGAGMWERVLPVIQDLDPGKVLVAFDADKRQNEHVARAERDLVAALLEEGYRVATEEWDLEAAKGIDDLLASRQTPLLCERIAPPADADEANEAADDEANTWELIDLDAFLSGEVELLEPTVLARTDGPALFYAGKVNALNAEPETGKSWVALAACAERMAAGEHVLYLDFEAAPSEIAGRLLALGVERETLRDRFHYVRPDDAFEDQARDTLLGHVRRFAPTLAVIDGVAEVMSQNALNEIDNADVLTFLKMLPRLLERRGVTVILIDHVTKSKDGRSRYARGAGAKLGGLSGAAYTLEVGRQFGKGLTGEARLVVTKDRHGSVRGKAAAGGKDYGTVVMAANGDGTKVKLTVRPPLTREEAAAWVPTRYMEKVSRVLEKVAPEMLTSTEIKERVSGKAVHIVRAVEALVDGEYVEWTKGDHHRTKLYRSVRPYRDPERARTGEPGEEEDDDF